MRNIVKKSFLLLTILVIGGIQNAFAYSHIGLANGTVELGTISKTPGAGNRFAKYKDGAYLYRSSAWSFSAGKGIKTQSSNSGVVFYLANPADITLSVLYDASKNFANVDATLYSISDSDYDKFFTGTENSTTVTISKTEIEKRTIIIDKKATFQETFSLAAGYYFVVCSGTASNTYFTQLIVGGSTPVTPAVSSITVTPTSITLEPNGTQQLTATVNATPSSADKTVTWNTSNASVATVSTTGLVTAVAQGSATITATSNLDNTKSGTCTVTVNPPAAPIEVESISMKSATTIGIGSSETLAVTYNPTDANTGKALTWSSDNEAVATVDANGKVTGVAEGKTTITATTANGKSATCTVTVQAIAVTGVSLNKSTVSIKVGNTETLTATVAPANATNKNVTWSSSNTAIATVNNGVVTAVAEGEATITVTTADGKQNATCTVKVTAGDPVPATNLTLHQPGIYEEESAAGGYNTELRVHNGYEYEVYYTFKGKISGSSVAAVATTPGGVYLTDANSDAIDGWFEANPGSMEESGAPAMEEFAEGNGDWKMKGESLKLHVKGYDMFKIVAADNDPSNAEKRFHVFLNGNEQTMTYSNTPTTRAFALSPSQEYLIEVKAGSSTQIKLYGFSLRVPKEPRVKYLDGNDSTQSVLQTSNIKPITYATKYNNILGAETRLVWDGKEASGISLTKIAGELSDTLVLKGKANCPVGEYKYRIAAYYNGVETNGLSGTFRVSSSIVAKSDTIVHAYTNETMDQIIFTYYAPSEEDVLLTWPNGQPEGIDGTGKDGRFIIGGTPTATGTFPYWITTTDGDTTITGQIIIKTLTYSEKSVLYIYKNNLAFDNDAVYQYLSGAWELIPRKQKEDGLRPVEQYANYKWVLISEDADANNEEVLRLIQGNGSSFVNIPVLNLKSFTYSTDRLAWGRPNNGSIDTITAGATKLYVQREDHSIFQSLNKKHGDSITIVEMEKGKQGVMPVEIQQDDFSYSLATAHTRDINDYYKDGEFQTVLHEMPAELRGGNKYICLGLARKVTLTAEGKKLLDAIVKYLTAEKAETLTAPELQITRFAVNGIEGEIDDYDKTITVKIDTLANPGLDYSALKTKIELKDPVYTYVKPADGSEVNYLYAANTPVKFIVSDYVRREVYNVKVKRFMPQGIEEVYEVGQWVNIYDIYGRKVTTTNEDIYTMELPRGMYIVVTEAGQTLKIMR